MIGDLWRLVYVSQASHDLTDVELVNLLDFSRQRNQRHDITGALAYDDQRFLQVLEADRPVVEALFQRICQDTRNRHQMTIISSSVATRAFAGWSMGWMPETEIRRAGFGLEIFYSGNASLGALDEIFIAFRKLGQAA